MILLVSCSEDPIDEFQDGLCDCTLETYNRGTVIPTLVSSESIRFDCAFEGEWISKKTKIVNCK